MTENDSNFTIATELGLPANATLEDVESAFEEQTGEVLEEQETFLETQEGLIEDFEAANELISYEAGQNPDSIKVLVFESDQIVSGEVMDPPITLKAYLA